MASVETHYATLLAPIYTWMAGGTEAAFDQGRADLLPILPAGSLAVDLGAGFGMHAVPLARLGWRVTAIDSSPLLLDELMASAPELPVTVQCADLLDFATHLPDQEHPSLILCMGDTLTHLPSMSVVNELIRQVAEHLASSGRFVATFRDYTRLPVGDGRFIPVRSDEQRILTCFLEDAGDHVVVHDLLHERSGGRWETQVSSYRKLKLRARALVAAFESVGMRSSIEQGPRGMLRLVADAQ